MRHPTCWTALAALLLAGCATPAPPVAGLRYIGEQRIALMQPFDGTVVGGLSSLDYDARSGAWILASDDRSEHGPARFYTARLDYDDAAFHAVTLTSVHPFRQADGSTYPAPPAFPQRGGEVADIEAVRFDPAGDGIWYASEGSGPLRLDPFVKLAAPDGSYRATLPLPPMLKTAPTPTRGARNNLTLEGLAFAPDGQSLWLAMEAPLYQDGPVPTPDHGAVSRFTRVDRAGHILAQYAYPLDPVQGRPAAGRFADNGVSEVLAVDATHLLVLERSGVQDAQGVFAFYIRLYAVNVAGATDVRAIDALAGSAYVPLTKRLVLNLNQAPPAWHLQHIDNLEGMAWGPVLADGHRSLVLVSDDNFSATQVTQLLAFAYLP